MGGVGGGGSTGTLLSSQNYLWYSYSSSNRINQTSSALKGNLTAGFCFVFILSLPSTTLDRRLTSFCLVIIIFLSWVCLHHPGLHFLFNNVRSIAWPIHSCCCVLCSAVPAGSASVAGLAWTINPSHITDSLPASGPVCVSGSMFRLVLGPLIVPLNLTVFLVPYSPLKKHLSLFPQTDSISLWLYFLPLSLL